jgi:hypothetical protein
MDLDFLENLSLHEKNVAPLLSISEMEDMESRLEKDEEEEGKEGKETPSYKDNSGLVPFTNEDNEDLDNNEGDEPSKKEENKTKPTPGQIKKYAAIIKALEEKTGEKFEDFNEEDFEDTPESFLDLLENWNFKKASNMLEDHIKENLSPLQQKFVELVDQGVSESAAADIVKNIKAISDVTPERLDESEDLAKGVYAQFLRLTTAFSDSKIKKEVDRLEELGTIIEEAKDVLPDVTTMIKARERQEVEAIKQREEQSKKLSERQMAELQEYINNTEEVGGIKLNKKLKDNWMKEYQLVPTEQGNKVNPVFQNRANNPQEFDALFRLYNAMGLFKWDARSKKYSPDFSAIKSLGKKDAISDLERAVTYEKNKNLNNSGFGLESTEVPEKDEMIKRLKEIKDFESKKKSNTIDFNI